MLEKKGNPPIVSEPGDKSRGTRGIVSTGRWRIESQRFWRLQSISSGLLFCMASGVLLASSGPTTDSEEVWIGVTCGNRVPSVVELPFATKASSLLALVGPVVAVK
jgi:hypothetical protein